MKQIVIHALPRGWGKSTQARKLFSSTRNSLLIKENRVPNPFITGLVNHIIIDDCSIDFTLKIILENCDSVEQVTVFSTFYKDPKVYLIPEIPRKWEVRLHSVVLKEEVF